LPLSCLFKEQEDEDVEHMSADHSLSAVIDMQSKMLQNKIAAKLKRKLKNRSSILDTGWTLGAGVQHDADCFHDTGLLSEKVFMLPNQTNIRETNKMQLKHNLRPKASEINIVPNLHSMLIRIPKMADADYIAVSTKKRSYNRHCYDYHCVSNKRPHPCCTMLPGHRTVETWPGIWSLRPRISWSVHRGV
jgi:hypothetical protein